MKKSEIFYTMCGVIILALLFYIAVQVNDLEKSLRTTVESLGLDK